MSPSARIVSLLSAGTEILYGLGLGDRVVAVSHECDYPAEVALKPRVTSSRVNSLAASGHIDQQVRETVARGEPLYEIDVEQIRSLAPDLIVTQAQCDVCAVRYEDVQHAVATCPELHRTQVVALSPQSLADVLSEILAIGEAAGCPDAAKQYVAGLASRIAAVRRIASLLPAAAWPRVACIEWLAPLMLAGNWIPEMVSIAGGAEGVIQAGRHSPYVDWRDVAIYDPEVIVITPCGFDLNRILAEARLLKDLPGRSNIAAVRCGRVFAVDGSAYFNRSGPRLVDSLEILAHLLHPGLFDSPLPAEKASAAWQQVRF